MIDESRKEERVVVDSTLEGGGLVIGLFVEGQLVFGVKEQMPETSSRTFHVGCVLMERVLGFGRLVLTRRLGGGFEGRADT